MHLIVIICGIDMRVSSPESFYQRLSNALLQFAGKEEFEIYFSADMRYGTRKKISIFAYFSKEIEMKVGEIKEELKKALIAFFPNGVGDQIPIIAKRMDDDFETAAEVQPPSVPPNKNALPNINLEVLAKDLFQLPLAKFLVRSNFETFDDIAAKTEQELLKMPGIGKKRLGEIKQLLKSFGRELRKD
jgi:DNA-directed RNA polymerase alpha subunit